MSPERRIDKARGDRIKRVRKEILNIRSQEEFADRLSDDTHKLTRGAVGNWETGKEISLDNLRRIAQVASVSLDWLAYGKGSPSAAPSNGSVVSSFDPDSLQDDDNGQERVPLLGYVRAGAETYYYAKSDDPLDWVPHGPNDNEHTVAVQVQGTSLGQAFDGWIIYYDEVRSPVTPDMFGRLCVAGLMDDRVVVKIIKPSKTPGLYNLISNNDKDDIEDAEVIWAARVKHMAQR